MLPMFDPGDDPGPDFAALLKRSGYPARGPGVSLAPGDGRGSVDVRHGTTVVALRFADGVVMAGDRRATEGYSIAHRAMDKVFPADRWSAVAIAGAAGPRRSPGARSWDPTWDGLRRPGLGWEITAIFAVGSEISGMTAEMAVDGCGLSVPVGIND